MLDGLNVAGISMLQLMFKLKCACEQPIFIKVEIVHSGPFKAVALDVVS